MLVTVEVEGLKVGEDISKRVSGKTGSFKIENVAHNGSLTLKGSPNPADKRKGMVDFSEQYDDVKNKPVRITIDLSPPRP